MPNEYLKHLLKTKLLQAEKENVRFFSDAWLSSAGNVEMTLKATELSEMCIEGVFKYRTTPVFAYMKALPEKLFDDIVSGKLKGNDIQKSANKVHLTYCKHIHDEPGRYYVTNRNDGFFQVDKKRKDMSIENTQLTIPLAACQYCLAELFPHLKHDYTQRVASSFNFNFSDFAVQGKGLNEHAFNVESVLNRFVGQADWARFSQNLRIQQKGVCEKCGLDFSSHFRFLHVHHINRSHYWNSRANAKVLCYGCHSDEPEHDFMKEDDQYGDFLKIKNALISQ